VQRGEVWVANLNPNRGGEIGKARPVVILQENRITETGLRTVLVAPLTTQYRPEFSAMRIAVKARQRVLKNCYVMVEHITALDRSRISEGPLTSLTSKEIEATEQSIRAILGLL